jgi:toxic protein SymE
MPISEVYAKTHLIRRKPSQKNSLKTLTLNPISMSTLSKLRKIKISYQYQKTVFKKPILKPKLILSGDWLQRAGFEIGENVIISVSNNLLIIEKLDNENNNSRL